MSDQREAVFRTLRIKMIGLFVTVYLSNVSANEEQSVSINKPVKNWMHFSSDNIRCYCNLPACVTKGYMCKSRAGVCFSDLLEHPTKSRPTVYGGRHGCLELLTDRDQRSWCENQEDNAKPPLRKKHPKSLLVCCRNDMCNHVENPKTKNILNSTLFGQILEDSNGESRQTNGQQETLLYSNSEVWFRAATIAVPICGAVILFVLIALAVKILKSENENSLNHKLGPALYIHQLPSQGGNKNSCEKFPDFFDRNYENLLGKDDSRTHHQNLLFENENEAADRQMNAPLLLQNEIYNQNVNKNETNAKLNLIQSDDVCDYLEKNTDNFPEVNIVKKINNDKFSHL
ncbi:unnamed protein product [Brassicogethes aeneus]|uniref:Uncharacterized protein n=1 Tax=Brassicogethes aeneus TaxID=1431903 RepID=A0A9P0B6X0_BRAAE|nr:unnamed protein product [Brassicogethes aeneus]